MWEVLRRASACSSWVAGRHGLETLLVLSAVSVVVVFGVRGASRMYWPQRANVVTEPAVLEFGQDNPRRSEPLQIAPTGAFRDLISDEDLGPIVASVEPRWPGPGIGITLHSLRLWGPNATFDGVWQRPQERSPLLVYDGPLQLSMLLDHRVFENAFRRNFAMPALLVEGRVGVSVLTNKDPDFGADQGQFHSDKLLQVLAEIGVPATEPVFPRPATASRRYWTVDDLIKESLWEYSPYQEPEFTTSAYARWLRSPGVWRNRFGEEFRMDDLVRQLLARPLGEGACLGIHVHYALISIYRANGIEPLVSDAVAAEIVEHFQKLSKGLASRQQADGAWNLNWSGEFHRPAIGWQWFLDVSPYPELLATGHHLEWMALAPPELCPPRDVVERAVTFSMNAIRQLPEPLFANTDVYPLGTHVVRALCLIRGTSAADIHRQYPVQPKGVVAIGPASGLEQHATHIP